MKKRALFIGNAISKADRSVGSPVAFLPFAQTANPCQGSSGMKPDRALLTGNRRSSVGGPQSGQRKLHRSQRYFLSDGIDYSIVINIAHRTLHCAGSAFAARTIRKIGTALITERHAKLLFESSLAVASMAK